MPSSVTDRIDYVDDAIQSRQGSFGSKSSVKGLVAGTVQLLPDLAPNLQGVAGKQLVSQGRAMIKTANGAKNAATGKA